MKCKYIKENGDGCKAIKDVEVEGRLKRIEESLKS